MMKEKNYYLRMNKSINDKIAVLCSYVKKNMNILDFGCGLSSEIADFVAKQNAKYFAVDREHEVQNELQKRGINIYNDINDMEVEIQFDIIFMSSVMHELFSYLNREERVYIMRSITERTKENGILIIRDWYAFDQENTLPEIKIVPRDKKEIQIWTEALKDNAIITENETPKNWYEIIYHTTWGLQSLKRESKEQYLINLERLNRYTNSFELTKRIDVTDETYNQYINEYFMHADYITERFPSKTILIYKKKKPEV